MIQWNENMKNQDEKSQLTVGHWVRVAAQWTVTLLPVTLVVVLALLVFREAVIASIASTPHPELVYAILGTFFAGVLLACITLARYTLEGNLASRWLLAAPSARDRLIQLQGRNSYLLPIYQVLLGHRQVPAGARQGVLEQEVITANARLDDRLTLPHYLAGALVGLGLVGTFVGLLGTLEDLGKLFAGLANTDSNANPADLFADMVRRLQDPMRGMGTAFVASLYGLLGSLVLGLQILVVAKIGHGLSNQMHELLRQSPSPQHAQQEVAPEAVSPAQTSQVGVKTQPDKDLLLAWMAQQQSHSLQLQQLVTQLQHQHQNSASDLAAVHQAQMAQMGAWVNEIKQLHSQGLAQSQVLRAEVGSVVEATNALVLAVRQSITADARYRESVPRTSYWQDAWIKVQAYLQRSNTDQVLSQLTQSSKAQEAAMVDAAAALARIDQRLGAHIQAQIAASNVAQK
jgi:hypothetical protein